MSRLSCADPGMTPDVTPSMESVTCFDTPSMGEPPSRDEDEIVKHFDALSLTSTDITSDPILRSLAKQQSSMQSEKNPSVAAPANFKAKLAPKLVEGAGPKLTKAAALRQGLIWEVTRNEKKEDVVFDQVPGHKSTGLGTVSLVRQST